MQHETLVSSHDTERKEQKHVCFSGVLISLQCSQRLEDVNAPSTGLGGAGTNYKNHSSSSEQLECK